MLSKYISAGERLELRTVDRKKDGQPEEKRVYVSQVYDILSEDTMEIVMPMEKAKLILLPVDAVFDLVLYGKQGLYQCMIRITDRYKSNNIYLLAVELISDIRKYQRREYYRLSCALEMDARKLTEDEVQRLQKARLPVQGGDLPLTPGIIVDISGGGIRFASKEAYEAGSLLYLAFYLTKNEEQKKHEVSGKVLSCVQMEQKKDTYEHRVEFLNISNDEREEIIRYIFETERKSLRRERSE